jgi:hypothetical protein
MYWSSCSNTIYTGEVLLSNHFIIRQTSKAVVGEYHITIFAVEKENLLKNTVSILFITIYTGWTNLEYSCME